MWVKLLTQENLRMEGFTGWARAAGPAGEIALEFQQGRAHGRNDRDLRGMGTDGADGMLAVKNANGRTIAQSQESCVVFGMPSAAIAKGGAELIVHGDEMAAVLIKLARGETVARV